MLKRGEDDVFAGVLRILAATGTTPVIELGPKDGGGEDRVVRFGDERITIQIITAGPGSVFWRQVATGRGEVEVDLGTAAGWVNQATISKAAMYSATQKPSMLLALDVRHLGVLADPTFAVVYFERYGATDDLKRGRRP